MHQTPRMPVRSSSPASSPQTNPTRTNNPIEPASPRPSSDFDSRDGPSRLSVDGGDRPPSAPTRDSIKKLDQIIQNIFSKAGSIIIQERMETAPMYDGKGEKKTSRWFQIDTDEMEDFRDDLRPWRQCGSFENRPRPLIIETYLDASHLKGGQSLAIMDDNGKRWDVQEALNSSDQSSDSDSSRPAQPNTEVILERWKIELRGAALDNPENFGPFLATIYKKTIVMMRSLYTTLGILPAWKLARRSKTRGVNPALQVRCRVLAGERPARGFDGLRAPLFESRGDVTTDYQFGQLDIPIGRFYASVSYRNSCSFTVVETESLLSSRIGIAISDDMFKPSLPRRAPSTREQRMTEVGSLPYHRHEGDIMDNQQRYGSLSTFHGEGPIGTSPISALRQLKAPGSDTTGSPPDSRPPSVEGPSLNSVPISGPSRRPSLRTDGVARRPSVSFQNSPFKRGSLSGSPVPRTGEHDVPSSPHSLTRPGHSALTHTRNRSSLTAGMPASLRGGPPPAAATATPIETPAAGSPRPAGGGRFSSSFTHRRNRPSFGGSSRAGDDDQNSSGKQSLSSSVVQPGSGVLNEAGQGGSSGSFQQTDDDNIQEFLKALESKRTLQSFETSKKSEAAAKRTNTQLSKFQSMRESNNALTESMNSSMQMQRSSSSSSRQLANVPGMSTSTSPGKPLSPHTPHTPAVPSRLSENSSADYASAPVRTGAGPIQMLPEEDESSAPVTQEGTTAIDIPMSPRTYPHGRRSNSVAHQSRALVDDDDHRSISVGANDGEAPSLSALLGRHQAAREDDAAAALQPAADIRTASSAGTADTSERDTRPPGGLLTGFSSSPYRRYGSSAGRGVTPPQSGSASYVGSSTGRYARGGGYSRGVGSFGTTAPAMGPAGAEEVEEEPLLFDMSELNRDVSRRSLEEARGGGGGFTGHRGGY